MSPETLAILNPFTVAHRYLDGGAEPIALDVVEDMVETIKRWTSANLG